MASTRPAPLTRVQAGRHKRAKALQWLLTNSFTGRTPAVRRVTDNATTRPFAVLALGNLRGLPMFCYRKCPFPSIENARAALPEFGCVPRSGSTSPHGSAVGDSKPTRGYSKFERRLAASFKSCGVAMSYSSKSALEPVTQADRRD
ncbi:reverse transcriptase N-terminal domain-containing protein [Paraburkholderia xenovorans]|uniref:reverse transcriptase N-terminal domain-containing protein n=1 Tax=Paraburkholderia xenovorans TaxID=36873 RepID=UPI0038B6B414